MKKLKSIFLKITLKGMGIVNFDSNEQKEYYYSLMEQRKCYDRNVKFAKKNWYRDKNGKAFAKIKISTECLKKGIYSNDMVCQIPSIQHSVSLIIQFLATIYSILNGFLATSLSNRRKGAITMTDS